MKCRLLAIPLMLAGMAVWLWPSGSASGQELRIYGGGTGISVYRPRAEVYVWSGRRGTYYAVVPYGIPYTASPGIYAYSPLATGAFRGLPIDPRDMPQAYPAGRSTLLYRPTYPNGRIDRGGVDPLDKQRIDVDRERIESTPGPPRVPEAIPAPPAVEDGKRDEPPVLPPQKPAAPEGPREF